MTIIRATLGTHTSGRGCEGAARYKECPFNICWLASANVGGMCQAANDHPLQLCMDERAPEQNNATGGRHINKVDIHTYLQHVGGKSWSWIPFVPLVVTNVARAWRMDACMNGW